MSHVDRAHGRRADIAPRAFTHRWRLLFLLRHMCSFRGMVEVVVLRD
jgi:hypothetical protein